MVNFTDANFQSLVIHYIGNKAMEEDLILADKEVIIEDELMQELLVSFFLSPFKENILHNFFHETDIEMNEIFSFAKAIFSNPENIIQESQNIAKHLYACGNHPKIKNGELYVVFFKDVYLDDEVVDCLGIFKSEKKDTYICLNQSGSEFDVECHTGVNINKMDKGCLVFNSEQENGFLVSVVDSMTKPGEEAHFWKDVFLKIKTLPSDYVHTNDFIGLCNSFSEEVLKEDDHLDKTEQVNFVKKTEEFFKSNDEFSVDLFQEEVFEKPELKESFQKFKKEYDEVAENVTPSEFTISDKAVKKSNKFFKSVLKLDKNFHVYVHGNPQMLDKGYDDEKRMKYYKLFYDQEK